MKNKIGILENDIYIFPIVNSVNLLELLRFMSGGRVVGVGGVQTLQMLHMLNLPILKFTTLK